MAAKSLPRWTEIIQTELGVNQARWNRMLCMTGCATLLATAFLVFRVPLPAYGAYVALMAYQRDSASSVVMSVGAIAAAVMAIALCMLLYLLDIDEPGLRVLVMAVAMFTAMYFSRAPRIGPLLFLTGFVLVVTQTLVDQISDGETLTHVLLWLALVILCACVVVPITENLFGRSPSDLFEDGIKERLALSATPTASPVHPTLSLRELAALAGRLGSSSMHRLAIVTQLGLIASLPFNEDRAIHCQAELDLLRQLDAAERDIGAPLPPMPDRLKHIQSLRFAFKATLAAMFCYVLYSGVDWAGIRTSIITCFFVALSSTGETIHKLGLRLAGALVGGLIAGVSIVFLFPVMDDIGGFIVLFASVTLLCAWVATAGPLIAYAGLQMAFAFYLGVLQDTGPTDDLTVLRDRLAGIVLGNVVMSIVFSTIWPVSAASSTRMTVARILRRQAELLRIGRPAASVDVVASATDLEEAHQLSKMAAFDLGLTPDRRAHRPALRPSLTQLVALSNVWLSFDPTSSPLPHTANRLEVVANYLDRQGINSQEASAVDPNMPPALKEAVDTFEEETTHAAV